MIVDYESTQSVEITYPGSYNSCPIGYREAEIVIGLEQTHAGTPPSFNPMDGGDPGSDPEWEVSTISFIDEDGKSREFGGLSAMVDIASTILGSEAWEELVAAAILDATENYVDDGGSDG